MRCSRSESMSAASSTEPNQPTFQSCNRPGLRWPSTSRPPRRSASLCPPRCLPPPIRLLNRPDFRSWHETDMPARTSDVRFRGQSGKHGVAASIALHENIMVADDGRDRRFCVSTETIDRLRSAAISTGVTRRSRSQRKFGSQTQEERYNDRQSLARQRPRDAPQSHGRGLRRQARSAALHRSDHGEICGADAGDGVRHAVDEARARPQDQDVDLRRLRHRNRADPELKLHIRFARNHGWTEDELVEAILHLLGYVGAPLVREALLVAKETFAEMRAGNPVTS